MSSMASLLSITGAHANTVRPDVARVICLTLPSQGSSARWIYRIAPRSGCSGALKNSRPGSLFVARAMETQVDESSTAAGEEDTIELEVKVEGMTCGHCTSRVEEALTAVPGVRSATASLETGIVTVAAVAVDQLQAAAVQLPAVVQAIQELGFGAEPHFSQEA